MIIKATNTTKLHLMIDMRATREAYANKGIHDVGWLRSKANLAEGLTKFGRCDFPENFLSTDLLHPAVDQWLVRPKCRTATTHPTGQNSRITQRSAA